MVKFRNKFIYYLSVLSASLLTTDEAAMHLRLSERKLYELVAQGAVPCTKVTPLAFSARGSRPWVTVGLTAPAALAHVSWN